MKLYNQNPLETFFYFHYLPKLYTGFTFFARFSYLHVLLAMVK